MAYYALLNADNIVTRVIAGANEEEGTNWELYYSGLFKMNCRRTSYNTIGGTHRLNKTPFRKNYAGIGYTYDESRDAFIPPSPHPSWVLNEESCLWEAPKPFPDDSSFYLWDESTLNWIKR